MSSRSDYLDVNYCVNSIVRSMVVCQIMLSNDKRGLTKTPVIDPALIGSRRVLAGIDPGMYPHFAESTFLSDVDIVTKLSVFQLDSCLDRLKLVPVEKLDPTADYSADHGAKKEVYRTSLEEFFPTNKQESRICASSKDLFKALPKNFNPTVDLIVTPDIRAVKKVWSTIDEDFFIKFCWKQSPTFMGKPALKALFSQLESLAMSAVGDERSLTSSGPAIKTLSSVIMNNQAWIVQPAAEPVLAQGNAF